MRLMRCLLWALSVGSPLSFSKERGWSPQGPGSGEFAAISRAAPEKPHHFEPPYGRREARGCPYPFSFSKEMGKQRAIRKRFNANRRALQRAARKRFRGVRFP